MPISGRNQQNTELHLLKGKKGTTLSQSRIKHHCLKDTPCFGTVSTEAHCLLLKQANLVSHKRNTSAKALEKYHGSLRPTDLQSQCGKLPQTASELWGTPVTEDKRHG